MYYPSNLYNYNKIISLDYDDVLVGMNMAMIEWAKITYNFDITLENIDHYDFWRREKGFDASQFWSMPDLYSQVEPLPDAAWFIREARSICGSANIQIVTVSNSSIRTVKSRQCESWFGITPVHVSSHGDKAKYTASGPFVDDYPVNIWDHISSNNQPGILFSLDDKYGWSCPENYSLPSSHPKMTKASSYEDILQQRHSALVQIT